MISCGNRGNWLRLTLLGLLVGWTLSGLSWADNGEPPPLLPGQQHAGAAASSDPRVLSQSAEYSAVVSWELVAVEVGFRGVWRAGAWIPLTLKLRSGGGRPTPQVLSQLRLELVTPDGDGQKVRWRSEPFELQVVPGNHVSLPMKFSQVYVRAGESEIVLKTLVQLGSPRAWIELKLWEGDQVVLERRLQAAERGGFPLGIRDTQPIYVFVGTQEAGLKEAFAIAELASDHRPVVAALEGVDELPASPLAYQAVRAIVLSFATPEAVKRGAAASVELAALKAWVASGGQVVVGFDPPALQLGLAQFGEAFSWLVPGKFEQGVPLSRTRASAIEMFAGARTPLGRLGTGPASWSVAYISEPQGQLRAAEGRLPLVVNCPYGLGTLTWCAFALDSPMITEWRDRGLFFARLLEVPLSGPNSEGDYARVTRYGFEDLAGQLRRSLDQFPDVVRFPFGLIVSLMLIHIALIGPLDYYLFRHAGRWRWLAWLSLGVIVAGLTGLAIALGLWAKGEKLRLQQLDLVDISAREGFVRASTWAHVFSPGTARLTLTAQPVPPTPNGDLQPMDIALGWWGLPGEGFGGMSSLRAEMLFENEGYMQSPGRTRLEGVTFRSASTKAVTAQCYSTTRSVGISWELRLRQDELNGWIRNQLPWALENCRLIFGKYVYQLETIPAGGIVVVDRSIPRRDLRGFLTGTQLVKEKDSYRAQTSPYDVASTDWHYILEMMMFHEAAGGTGYTGLVHVAEGWIDFSSRLATNQAILVAEVAGGSDSGGGIRFQLSQDPAVAPVEVVRRVFHRWLLPVTQETATSDSQRML